MSLGCVVNNKTQCDQHPWAYQSQEAHHRPSDQHIAAWAGLRQRGTLLGRCPLDGETVVLDDVAIVWERRLDDHLLVDLAVQTKARVSQVTEGIGEVSLQVDTIQSVCWGGGGAHVRLNTSLSFSVVCTNSTMRRDGAPLLESKKKV